MRAFLVALVLLTGAGCHGWPNGSSTRAGVLEMGGNSGVEQSAEGAPCVNASEPHGPCLPEQGSAPTPQTCKPCEEIHVHVPSPKVIVRRRQPPAAPPNAPSGPVTPSQEVLLIPRVVYVPYMPQVPTGPARMSPLQMSPAAPLVPVLPSAPPSAPCAPAAPGQMPSLADAQKTIADLEKQCRALEAKLDKILIQAPECKAPGNK